MRNVRPSLRSVQLLAIAVLLGSTVAVTASPARVAAVGSMPPLLPTCAQPANPATRAFGIIDYEKANDCVWQSAWDFYVDSAEGGWHCTPSGSCSNVDLNDGHWFHGASGSVSTSTFVANPGTTQAATVTFNGLHAWIACSFPVGTCNNFSSYKPTTSFQNNIVYPNDFTNIASLYRYRIPDGAWSSWSTTNRASDFPFSLKATQSCNTPRIRPILTTLSCPFELTWQTDPWYAEHDWQIGWSVPYIAESDAGFSGEGGLSLVIPISVAAQGTPDNHAPTATCTATSTGTPGSYHFLASASDQDQGDVLDYQWDYDDSTPQEGGDSRTHAYALPGQYDASVTVTDSQGASVVAACGVTVPAPELNITVSLVDHESRSLNQGEEVTARVHVAADPNGVGSLTGIRLESPGLLLSPNDHTLDIIQAADVSAAFDLEPGGTQDFDFKLKANGAGRVELKAHGTATDAAGRAVDKTSSPLTLNVSVLKVELSINPEEIDLTETEDGPQPMDVTLTVKITNTSTAVIDGISIVDTLNITSRDATVPHTPPMTEESGPTADGAIGTLQPNASATRTFVLKAKDDGKVRVQAIVEATDPDGGAAPIRTAGQLDIDIDPDYVLYLETELVGAGGGREKTLEAGAPALIKGFIENRSNDHKVKLNPLDPIITGDLGCARPVPTWRMQASGPQNGCTLPLEGVLEPGQKVEFQALVQTFIGTGTRATVDYKPSGSLLDAEGNETTLKPEQVKVKTATLPFTLHINDEVPTAPAADLSLKYWYFSVGEMNAVPQWLGTFFSGIKDSPRIVGELLGKGLASLPGAADFLSNYLVGVYIEENGPHEMALRITNDIVEATGRGQEEVLQEVNGALDGWTVPFYEAWESADYETAFGMLGGVAGNITLEILSCYAKLPEAARFIELAQVVKETGLAKRLSEGLRALSAGDNIPFAEMRRLFGIAQEQGLALKQLAQDKGLLITARFRQPKSLEWIREKLAVLKPERIKLKNVDEIDVGFLGYNQAHEASVIVKRPLDLTDERAAEIFKLKKSNPAAFDAALDAELSRSSSAYAGASEELQKAARERLATRVKEWVSPDAGYVKDMRALAARQRIELPWNYKDNFLPGTEGLPGTYTERGFQLFGDNQDYLIVQMKDKAGNFRPVTGDIDIVGIQKANGKGLSSAERVEIYKTLQETTGMQHPESATWIGPNGEVIFDYKAELLADHAPGGEPLIQFSPDGEARAVFISPEMSYFNTATGDAHMWYVGGYRQPKPTVFNFGGTNLGVYFPDRPAPGFVPYVAPGQWVIDGVGAVDPNAGTLGVCQIEFGSGPDAQILGPNGSGGLQRYLPENNLRAWELYDTSACGSNLRSPLTANSTSTSPSTAGRSIVILPQSGLAAPVSAGATTVEIADLRTAFPQLFNGPDSWFKVGQQIVVNPGTATEERRTIVGLGSLVLDQPLSFAHEVGEMVSVLPSADQPPVEPPTTPPTTAPADSAYGLKQSALAALQAMSANAKAKVNKRLAAAAERITASLALWRWNGYDALSPVYGRVVFNTERKAIQILTGKLFKSNTTAAGVIQTLLSADKRLVQLATAANTNARDVALANKRVSRADALIAKHKYAKALNALKAAWLAAT